MKKLKKKKKHGSYDFRSDGTVCCVRWNDKCAVTVASNYYGVTPILKTERRVKHECKSCKAATYNKYIQ